MAAYVIIHSAFWKLEVYPCDPVLKKSEMTIRRRA